MNLFRKREQRVDTAALNRQAEESLKTTSDQQERVTFISSWLERRGRENGFGEDFEFTLRPKEAK